MKYIGRIVTKNKKDIEKRVYDFIEVIDPSSFVEDDRPTLIIGLSTARELYGKENVKVLDKKLLRSVQWTHSKMEHRNIFEKDLKNFIDDIYKKVRKSIHYIYIDFLNDKEKSEEILNSVLNYESSISKVVFKNGKHYYIYLDTGIIYGLSLEDTEYLDIPDEEIEKLINDMVNTVFFERSDLEENKTLDYIGEDNLMLTYLCGK